MHEALGARGDPIPLSSLTPMADSTPAPSSPGKPPTSETPTPAPPAPAWFRFGLLAVMLAGMLFWQSTTRTKPHPGIDYSDVYRLAENKKLKSVELRGQEIRGELTEATKVDGAKLTRFQSLMPPQGDPDLLPLLRKQQVRVSVASDEQPFALSLVMELLPWLLILGAWVWLSRRAQKALAGAGGSIGGLFGGRSSKRFDAVDEVDVTFDDVAGQANAKRDLLEVVEFLEQPERFQRLGGKVPRGVLLVGPPGTGKTLLAKSL
ncbi:MAG: hypothetical protein KC731_08725, partial [Myxococcales bacterium]|nr:hypothetical protein [Myxococcales bacterium]